MSDQDLDDDDEVFDGDLFDVETVKVKVHPVKRRDQTTLTFYDVDGRAMNMLRIYGSLVKYAEQIRQELGISPDDQGEH